MSGIRSRTAVAAALAALSCVACTETVPGTPDLDCVQNGTCQCVTESDCAAGQVCVNGQCYFVQVTDAGAETVQPDALADATPDVTPDTSGPDGYPEIPIVEGGWLWPCTDDAQCNSNKCIEGPSGDFVCTKTCVERCDPLPDWNCQGVVEGSSTAVFYCFPEKSRLCEACVADSSCPGTSNLCIDVGGANRCGQDCTDGGCPTGYDCIDTTSVDGVAGSQCVPTGGACECTADNIGELLPCELSNEFGTCFGTQPCQDGGVLGACSAATPAAEVCDGEDNDCNGFADDSVPITTCETTNGEGTCTGDLICLASVGEVCNAPDATVEACDQLDNDCDGDVDEDFKNAAGAYNTLDHCGQCGNSCNGVFANATTVICDDSDPAVEPACTVTECEQGFVLNAGVCVPPVDSLCEPCTSDVTCGSDSDKCYQVDPTDTRNFCLRDCSAGNIYGDCPSGYSCQTITIGGTDFQQCFPDNNSCDCTAANAGQVKPCANTNDDGQCFGVATCDPALGWTGCTAATPSAEVCDGADNNCDGIIDEGLGGQACDNTNGFGTCTGLEICDPQAQTLTCAAPDAELDVCDGQDNDCDGVIDQDFAENITDPGTGAIVALKYYLDNAHCGGCGIACTANPPATQVTCDGSGQDVFCRIEACEPGFYVHSSGTACLPLPNANLCLPCAADTDCQGPADTCLTYDEGSFCGRDCSEGSIYSEGSAGDATYCTGAEGVQDCCPSGFLCTSGQCKRESNACSCDVDGKQRPCSTTNTFGTCQGAEVCQTTGAGAGWQPCNAPTPAAEVCDGADNDCDGLVDQADSDIDTSGLSGYPDCQNVSAACSGTWACANVSGSFEWLCSAPEPAAAELCNQLDDDCDGETDEDFVDGNGDYTQLDNCGQCGLDCTQAIANLASGGGSVTCELVGGSPRCVPQACASGHVLFPTTGTPSVCLPVSAKNCQPCSSDNECGAAGDKCVGVGTDPGNYCAQRCDANAPYAGCNGNTGEQSCCPSGFTCEDQGGDLLCAPSSGTCQCSALSDGLTRVCSATGNGGATTCFGTETCADQGGGAFGWGTCDLGANIEVCDGLDNNCDGVTDEGFQTGGVYDTDEHCGQCGKNCALAFSAETQHVFGVCDSGAPGGPDCAIGGCLSDTVGGGTPCSSDADCAGNAAGTTCLPDRFVCGQTCSTNGDCPGSGVCSDGTCTISCGGDSACTSEFGPTSSCSNSVCVTSFTWVDLDTLPGNGCECAQAAGAVDEPESFATYPVPGATYIDRNCDGVDGDVATSLFVVPGGTGTGTLANPFGSIQAAIDAFNPSNNSAILVATGVYAERIDLSNGVVLHGGYSQDFQQRDIVLFPTVIAGVEDGSVGSTPGTVHAVGITETTLVVGFDIIGYDATSAGTTSYAVYVRSSSDDLQFLNNRISGGQGAAGNPGGNGSAGAAGNPGGNGADAVECNDANCNNDSSAGGLGGTNPSCGSAGGCEGMECDGGEDPQTKDGAASGCTYANGGGRGQYNGGPANLCKYDFNPPASANGPGGSDGSNGSDGSGGNGCNDTDGQLSGNFWSGDAGANGTGGGAGTGGQGGSAGGFVRNLKTGCSVQNPFGDLGGTGGGGGAGGCGGTNGAGGNPGGASFAVFIRSGNGGTRATVSGNLITRGFGGVGGAGGNGGSGGTGGTGGSGGIAEFPSWGPGIGGGGGRGGDGGDGGGGGGGCGGPAYGIAGNNINVSTYTNANTFLPGGGGGDGGPGGLSPAGGGNGSAGAGGATANVKQY